MAWGHCWSRHIMHEFKFSYNSLTNVMLIFFLFSKTEKLLRRQTGVLQWSWALRKSACCLWEWCFMVGAVLVLKVAIPLLSALKKKIISKGRATSWSSTHDVPLQSWKQHCKWQSLGPWYPSTSTKKSRFFFFFFGWEEKKHKKISHLFICVGQAKKKHHKNICHTKYHFSALPDELVLKYLSECWLLEIQICSPIKMKHESTGKRRM